LRVLFVADRNASTKRLRRRLEATGVATDHATDRQDAHRKALRPGCDVIVLDMQWSYGDPVATLQDWRRGGVTGHILALTPSRSTAQTVRILDLGADDVLARPFETDEFLARVRAMLRRSEPPRDRVLRVHDLEIDKQTHIVRRGGRAIPLTPREFALLEVLAERPGCVVSRAAIWQHLYDGEGGHLSNVVDVYIRYLRNKIDRGFDVPLILTRWGQGYLLRAEGGGIKAG
jgi:DNA-binding response OmpR family regulator